MKTTLSNANEFLVKTNPQAIVTTNIN